MPSVNQKPNQKAIVFIPQRLSLGFWVIALSYTALLAFVPLFILFDLLQEAWQAGRLQSSSLPELLVLLVIIAILLSFCWGFGRYFFEKWHMARMDEFWARRDGEFSRGIAVSHKGVSVQLFDEQFFVPKQNFRQFTLLLKPSRYSQVPYLQLHYLEHGNHKTQELYWNDLLWSKMKSPLGFDETLGFYKQNRNTQEKQAIVEYLNKLLEGKQSSENQRIFMQGLFTRDF